MTLHVSAQEERETTIEFLGLMNRSNSTAELVKAAATFFQQRSGCEALGIRLKEDDDYPYYEARGFSGEFILLENHLCHRNAQGCIVRNSRGDPVIECMCGNVICGRVNPTKPFFSAGGSFWANDTTRLLATTTDDDRQTHSRNRCNGEGYESVALVPLVVGQERIGLLQLNDRRKGMFSPEIIALWERLAGYLAMALSRARLLEQVTAEKEHLAVTLTNARRVEDALRKRDAELQVLIKELHSGVALVDKSGRFTLVNRRFLEIFGMNPDGDIEYVNSQDCTGWQILDDAGRLLDKDDRPVRKAALTRQAVHNQLVAVRLPSCGDRWLRVSAQPMLGADGTLEQLICTYYDVTQPKVAEDALREADRRKDEFLGMLSHELRNPLAPIRNSTYILEHAVPGSEQAKRAQAVIGRQTEHLTHLVDDLLDVTRIARGKIELRRARIDLRDVVWRAADDYRLVLHDRGVDFEVTVPEKQLWAEADATRITQIVGNLLHNAAKFTGAGDKVLLSMQVSGGVAEIRVRDTGAGIEPELLPTVFEPFVQGKRTLARTEGGLGLGLALVKGIAEMHGGNVEARSAGKDKGSDFVVRLPLPATVEVHADTRLQPASSNGGRRVLVVDDNKDAAESLAEIIRMLGHTADVAYDGQAAIEKVRTNPPNMVLCDIGLPGMSGFDVAKALRSTSRDGMQLIAVSGYTQPEDVRRAIEAGFDGHVAKPCDLKLIERLFA